MMSMDVELFPALIKNHEFEEEQQEASLSYLVTDDR